ncbi:hypothetical protein GCM10025866_01770 [Naasia aerilata]|uniref:Sulfatase-modifying factor enzyme-like domain-containing protein n=1 Tax=Naasia aerilata TaxID=1162966 RepID=A0ABM8G847_9MICO|nr:hypothetical protein GCM10025866_01770 [Naasia aerilata]
MTGQPLRTVSCEDRIVPRENSADDRSRLASNAPDNHEEGTAACCLPSFGFGADAAPPSRGAGEHRIEQVELPGGSFLMGDSTGDGNPADGEEPVHRVALAPFSIDATTVTNADFARFVEATGYVTEAEAFGYSAVFHLALAADPADVMGRAAGTPGGSEFAVPTGVIPAEPGRRSTGWRTAPSYTSAGTTRRPMRRGRAGACRARRSGSTPPAAT